MADTVWHRVDRELNHRKAAHVAPGSWAALGRLIGASNQTLTNWKTRGVPPKEYLAIAGALGWSVDQLLGKEEPPSGFAWLNPATGQTKTPSEMAKSPSGAPAEPPVPPRDFKDRHEISDSDFATLYAVKLLIPEERLEEYRRQAAHIAKMVRADLALTAAGDARAHEAPTPTPPPAPATKSNKPEPRGQFGQQERKAAPPGRKASKP